MPESCPVCGEPFEFRQVEEGAVAGPGISIEVDELCTAESDVRWDRICPLATTVDGEDGDPAVRLEVFRHHWDATA